MAATLVLDTITSSGAGITIDATKTFTVNGSLLSNGSSNILRKTGDYTILEGDVSGKSELIIATNAAAGTRTITLPAVATTGLSTCIVTIICDTDATSTYKLLVQDSGTTEVWTGYQNGDFVRLIVSNSVWVVVDHKETMFSSRAVTADFAIAASAVTKVTGFTNITEIGNTWDNANNKLVSPFAGFWDLNWGLTIPDNGGTSPVFYVGGVKKFQSISGVSAGSYNYISLNASLMVKVAASADIEFYSHNGYNGAAQTLQGNGVDESQFNAKFTRTY